MGLRWQLVLSFVALFLIGGLCGSALTLVATRPRPQPARLVARWQDTLSRRLTHRLKLNPEQQDRIKPKLDAAFDQIRGMHQSAVQQADHVVDDVLAQIESDLNPEQKALMEAFRIQRRARIEKLIHQEK